jgi:hypothetical protein
MIGTLFGHQSEETLSKKSVSGLVARTLGVAPFILDLKCQHASILKTVYDATKCQCHWLAYPCLFTLMIY